MEQKQLIRQYCQQFNITGINKTIDELITDAEHKALGYLDYTVNFLRSEADYRYHRDYFLSNACSTTTKALYGQKRQ